MLWVRYPNSSGHRSLHRGVIVLCAAMGFVAAVPARASERITLDGAWTRLVEGEDPVEFGVPSSFHPIDGVAAYIRRFTLEAEFLEPVTTLHFDGIVGQATVTLNDVELGSHGSFTPFFFEVSSILRAVGVENVLTVVIDDHRDATTIPAEEISWLHYSGIYRNVYLKFSYKASIVRSRIQYDFSDPAYSNVNGEVNVDLIGQPGAEVSLFGAILEGSDAEDLQIVEEFTTEEPFTLRATGTARVTLDFSVANPRLWSPEDPNLYTLWVVAVVDGLATDESVDKVGFRDIAVEGQDILLNGRPVFLKGVNRHDIYEATGFFGTEEEILEDMTRIKQMGFNFVRLIHYPHHSKVLDLADDLGLMASSEIPALAEFSDATVRDKLYTMYAELIERDMNHPAVIMWISGSARGRPMPYAAEAQQLAKSLDRNRLASYVIDNDLSDAESITADAEFVREAGLDVYAKVTFWFWYLESLQEAWKHFPKDIPLFIAEVGYEGNDRVPVTITDAGDSFFASETQQALALSRVLEGWRPYLPFYSEEHITGLTIFNWQDIDWPDITLFQQNHIPSMHYGMVYADREEKQALETVSEFFSTLPTDRVGPLRASSAELEEAFVDVRNLPAPINTASRQLGPSLSGSGSALYFAADGPDFFGVPRLFVAELTGGAWNEPGTVDIPLDEELFAFRRSPSISFDERTAYFTRCVFSGIFVVQTRTRIWSAENVRGRWREPRDLGNVVNTSDPLIVTSDPSVTVEGNTLYFSSNRPGGFGGTDLWVSKRIDSEWQFSVNLGERVNSIHDDAEPSISADENTLYFSSDRPGGYGSSDIWVSHRVDGEWTEPKNLGPEVNTTGAEREPEISKDDNYLYFTGIRGEGRGLSEIWFARRPGAPDPSDVSSARTVEVRSNNPGTIVLVTPSDVDHQDDGAADPVLTRRYQPGTPVALEVPLTYSGFAFWRWRVDGRTLADGQILYLFEVAGDVELEAEYIVPESASIVGLDRVDFDVAEPSASAAEFSVSVLFVDGSTQVPRAGVSWSVDDEGVATIDPVTGMLTPAAVEGQARVTVFAEVVMGTFKLPVAPKVVELVGTETEEEPPEGLFGLPGVPNPCGAVGALTLPIVWLGFVALTLVGGRRPKA